MSDQPLTANTKTPHSLNTFLVDGQVEGTWRLEDEDADRLATFHAN